MTDAALPFAEWHSEITEELATVQEALIPATADLRDAEEAHATAQVRHTAIREAMASLRGPFAHALASRARVQDEALYDTASAVARARGALSSLRERIADLEQALSEIAVLMAPAAEAAEDQVDAAD